MVTELLKGIAIDPVRVCIFFHHANGKPVKGNRICNKKIHLNCRFPKENKANKKKDAKLGLQVS